MYDIEYHESFKYEDTHWWFLTRDRMVFDIIDQRSLHFHRKLDLFDVGCGTGGLLSRCKNHPSIGNFSGCEPNEVGLHYLKKRNLKAIQGGVDDLHKIEEHFDVVTCLDVLYHKNVKPDVALTSIRNLLKDNGILIVNVAAIPQLSGRHDIRDQGARRFLKSGLNQLLTNSGYTVETLRYWNMFLTPPIWIVRFLQKTFPLKKIDTGSSEIRLPNKFINKSLITLLAFEQRLSRKINYPFGCSLFAVAQKSHS